MSRTVTPQVRLNRWNMAGVSAVALIAPLVAAGSAHAISFNRGELSGSFDTTLTVAGLVRVEGAADDLIGVANGGRQFSTNGDDGNLNYNTGIVSLVGRATHELKLNYRDIGAFVRGTYFYDVVNAKEDSDNFARTGRFPLSDDTVERVGKDIDLLDALVFGSFAVGEESYLDIRLGNQVLSWGESTFIANGINTINPVDVSALRLPGAELKEGFVPVPIADVSFAFTPNLSLEAFYQFKWKDTEPEAAGSFFSTGETASPGSRFLSIGFGNYLFTDSITQGAVPGGIVFPANLYPDPALDPFRTPQSLTPFGTVVPRAPDAEPDDQGQFGFALRYFSPELNDTEFGAYYINYHSRVPLLSSQIGTLTEFSASPSTFTLNSSYRAEYPEDIQLLGLSFNTSLPYGVSIQAEYSYRLDQPLQLDDVELVQATLAAPSILGTISGVAAQGAAGGSASFNAAVAAAVAGNPALAPFTGLTFEQIQAASPTAAAAISAGIAAAPGSPGGTRAAFQAAGTNTALTTGAGAATIAGTIGLFNTNQIIQRVGVIPTGAAAAQAFLAQNYFGQRIQGWDLFDVSQFQFTASKAFGPVLGANQWVLVTEAGFTWIHDMPDGSVLRLEGPGTVVGGNPLFLGRGGMPAVATDGFGTEFSWGYRTVVRFDYLNAIAGVNLFPSISWQHDVQGTTPTPLGNFVEDRKALGLGLRAVYRDIYTVDLNYSAFFGGGENNLIRDRDFVSVSFKYAF